MPITRTNWLRWIHLLITFHLVFLGLCFESAHGETEEVSDSAEAAKDEENELPPLQFAMEKPRVITVEELATYDGEGPDGIIWLSILGEVYDVTKGVEYYKKGYGYAIFAGRDGSVPFISGNFDEEESKKLPLETLSDAELHALDGWRRFYAEEKRYFFVGLLQGYFYNEDGGPTFEMSEIRETIRGYKVGTRQKFRQQILEERAEAAKEAAEEKATEGNNVTTSHSASTVEESSNSHADNSEL